MLREQKAICSRLSQAFLTICNNDIKGASDLITRIQFTNIQVFNDLVILTVRRPGLLIGKRGENIETITRVIDKPIKIAEDCNEYFDDAIIYEMEADQRLKESMLQKP